MASFIIKSDCFFPLRHSSLTIVQRPKRDIIKIATEVFGVMLDSEKKEEAAGYECMHL